MRRARPSRKTGFFTTLLLILAAGVCWILLGPSQYGGLDTYVITAGISMNPLIYQGDFVVVRRQSSYHVGEVVAYKLKNSLILHRIVATDGPYFVMKGDNNSYRDPTEPSPGLVAGRMWIHIPAGGKVVGLARTPWFIFAALLLAAITVFSGKGAKRTRRRGKTAMNRLGSGKPATGSPLSSSLSTSFNEEGVTIAAIVAVAALVLVAITFSHSLQQTGRADVGYQQTGSFTYAGAAGGSLYPGGKVVSGDPVYLRLVRDLDLGFNYRFASSAPHQIQGSYQLVAELSQQDGWKQSAEIVPITPFQGDSAAIAGNLDLLGVQAAMNDFDRDTGLQPGSYTLTLLPIVNVQGNVAGEPLKEQFAPTLVFRGDQNQLSLAQPDTSADPLQAAQSAKAPSDPLQALHPSTNGSVTRPRLESNTLSLFGFSLGVAQARFFSVLALLAGLAAVAFFGLPLLAAGRADEPERIRARYGAMLLDVHGAAQALPEQRIVDVLRPEDLAKIAEREGRLILHSNGSSTHHYLVSDGEIVYRYLATSAAGGSDHGEEQRG